eukprot:gb/GFBE01014578.1/.p1 GENE.gb/GFBE01014578.1/~~gb/GFBE01014578.1/.p1  ORF type:complete len:130 (+),score=7.70 gb/GFBE01014578.1/:1-390(+)
MGLVASCCPPDHTHFDDDVEVLAYHKNTPAGAIMDRGRPFEANLGSRISVPTDLSLDSIPSMPSTGQAVYGGVWPGTPMVLSRHPATPGATRPGTPVAVSRPGTPVAVMMPPASPWGSMRTVSISSRVG